RIPEIRIRPPTRTASLRHVRGILSSHLRPAGRAEIKIPGSVSTHRGSHTTKPKILRNLARIFPTFLRRLLWRAQACLRFSEPEQLHANKGGSKLPHSKEHSGTQFWLRLCRPVKISPQAPITAGGHDFSRARSIWPLRVETAQCPSLLTGRLPLWKT